MIIGNCRTNIDDWRSEKWPTVFAAVPKKGDAVCSEGGAVLYVCRITHSMQRENFSASSRMVPHISVELTNFAQTR